MAFADEMCIVKEQLVFSPISFFHGHSNLSIQFASMYQMWILKTLLHFYSKTVVHDLINQLLFSRIIPNFCNLSVT